MKMNRVGLAAVGLFLAAGVISRPAAWAQVTIEPIVKSIAPNRDPVPGRTNCEFRGESNVLMPAMNASYDVVFRAFSTTTSGSDSAWGLYAKRVGEPLAVLVDTTLTAGAPTFPVPGRSPQARFLDFKAPLLNNAGYVVFHGTFTDPVGGSGSGVYSVHVTGGPIVKLMDTFDVAPGMGGASVLSFIFSDTFNQDLTPAVLNDPGQVAIWGRFDGGGNALFGTTVLGGEVVQLAGPAVIPTGTPLANPLPFVEVRPTYTMNNDGVVAFNGSIRAFAGGPLRPGVFRVPVSGESAPETLAFHLQVAPEAGTATYVNFSTADIDENGRVAFTAGLTDGRGGFYTIDGPGQPVIRVLDSSDGAFPVPHEGPGAAFNSLVVTPMSESGQFGFWSLLRNATTPNNEGIYLAEIGEPNIRFVQDAAATAPGLSAPARLTSFLGFSAAINDSNNLVFAATGINESGTGGLRGLYFFDNCANTVMRIVDSTQSAALLGGTFSTLGTQNRKLVAYQGQYTVAGRYLSFTPDNRVVFLAQFSNFDFGIYVATITTSGGGGQLEITCPDDVELACPADTDTSGLGKATAIDRCTGASIPTTFADTFTPSCGAAGTLTRVWTADDGQGHTATCTQTIVLDDETAPELVGVPADATAECDAVPPPANVTATDTCDPTPGLTFDESTTPGACEGSYTLVREWSAVDACDNATSAEQTITVTDTTAPEIDCPADQLTLACGADVSTEATGVATAEDNCSEPEVTHSDNTTSGCGATVSIARTWRAEDDCGNDASCVQHIATVDTAAPSITCPADQTDLACGADLSVAARGSATATDDCGSAEVSSSDQTVAGCSNTVSVTRTWQATDVCGNSASCVQNLSTADTTAPTITCPPDQTGLECGADTSPEATGTATATDDCGTAQVTHSDAGAPGSCGGSIARTWIATDECGNTASCVQTISTVDDTPPTITLPVSELVVNDQNCSGNETVTLPAPTAEDACGSVTVTSDAPSSFPAGQTTTVTYTATDSCDNQSTASLDVTVNYGSTIVVDALRYHVGIGHHPLLDQEPIADIEVCAYRHGIGSCPLQQCGILYLLNFACVINKCAPVACATTDEDGYAELHVPPGNYLVIAEDATFLILPSPLGTVVQPLSCGETELARLRQLEVHTGKRYAAKMTRLTGSELLIVEPEEILWDDSEQPYPFVFESVGDWDVTVTVTPPEGFVADHEALSETVDNETEAVQFVITEVGSDLVPTKTTFYVNHNGRRHVVRSEVGISLTAEYARERGFNVADLRAKGLIKEPQRRPHVPRRTPTASPATER